MGSEGPNTLLTTSHCPVVQDQGHWSSLLSPNSWPLPAGLILASPMLSLCCLLGQKLALVV